MNTIELLPCPFCGGQATVKFGTSSAMGANDRTAKVVCVECGSSTKTEIEWSNGLVEVVVSLWNKRLSPLSDRALQEETDE